MKPQTSENVNHCAFGPIIELFEKGAIKFKWKSEMVYAKPKEKPWRRHENENALEISKAEFPDAPLSKRA